MSSTVRGDVLHPEERRQEPPWREVHDSETTPGPQGLTKACVGLHGPRDVMVDVSHQNRIAAAAFETGVGFAGFDHGKVLEPRSGRRRSDLTATFAVNLGGEDVTGRPDEPGQLQ